MDEILKYMLTRPIPLHFEDGILKNEEGDPFFEHICLRLQVEYDFSLAAHFHFLILIAQELGDQDIGSFDVDGKTSVNVGQHTPGLAFNENIGPGNSQIRFIEHNTRHVLILGEGG